MEKKMILKVGNIVYGKNDMEYTCIIKEINGDNITVAYTDDGIEYTDVVSRRFFYMSDNKEINLQKWATNFKV